MASQVAEAREDLAAFETQVDELAIDEPEAEDVVPTASKLPLSCSEQGPLQQAGNNQSVEHYNPYGGDGECRGAAADVEL